MCGVCACVFICGVYIHMVCVCVVCVCACLCVWVWKLEVNIRDLPPSLSTLFFSLKHSCIFAFLLCCWGRGYAWAHTRLGLGLVEDDFWDSVLSFHHVVLRTELTSSDWAASFYSLSHLTNPPLYFLRPRVRWFGRAGWLLSLRICCLFFLRLRILRDLPSYFPSAGITTVASRSRFLHKRWESEFRSSRLLHFPA